MLLVRDPELPEELHRPPLRPRVTDLHRDCVALLRPLRATREGAGPEIQRRGGEERIGAQQSAVRSRCQRRREASLRLLEVDAAEPERPESDAEPQCIARLPGEQRVVRRTKVRCFAIEPRRITPFLGKRKRPRGVPFGERTVLAGFRQPLTCVQAHGLE